MSKMSLDEAIQHAKEVASQNRSNGCIECAEPVSYTHLSTPSAAMWQQPYSSTGRSTGNGTIGRVPKETP